MYKGLHPITRHNEATIFVMTKLKGNNSHKPLLIRSEKAHVKEILLHFN